ncbi:MAG: hypothetical protein U1E48_02570 [Paracoccaceae bacterium]
MRKTIFLGLFTIMATALPVGAATLYDCKIDAGHEKTIIGPEYYFAVHEKTGVVEVGDGLIRGATGKDWMAAKVKSNDAAQLIVTWSVDRLRNDVGQITDLSFRAVLTKADGTIALTAVPSGYNNRFFHRGSCTAKQVK